MAWDSNGNYVLPSNSLSPDAASGTTISSDDFDELTADLATALSLCLTEDGQNIATTDLPMGGNRHTGVDDAAALTDYASANQVVDNALTYAADAGGDDTYAISLPISPGAYAAGNRFQCLATTVNTGACTLNVNSLGAKDIKLASGDDPYNGAIQANSVFDVIYDGTNFILLNPFLHFSAITDEVTSTHTELNYLDGSTAGTAVASTALVVDASKDIDLDGGDLTAEIVTVEGRLTMTSDTSDILMGYDATAAGYLKRITSKDGSGEFNILAGAKQNGAGGHERINADDASGACWLNMDVEGENGKILLRSGDTGASGANVTWANGPAIEILSSLTRPRLWNVTNAAWEYIASEDYTDSVANTVAVGGTASPLWTDFPTAALDTTYNNGLAYPVEVSISLTMPASAQARMLVGSASPPTVVVSDVYNSAGTITQNMTVIVPAGQNWRVSTIAGSPGVVSCARLL